MATIFLSFSSLLVVILIIIVSVSLSMSLIVSVNGQDIKRVLLYGVDALMPTGIENAETPNLDSMINNGASTMTARTVMPTISGPGWNSFLLSGGPEEIGITDNSRVYRVPPIVNKTLFDVIKEFNPNLKTMMYSGFPEWWLQYITLDAIDLWLDVPEYTPDIDVVQAAAATIIAESPDVIFVYSCDVDTAGHSYGYDTPRYYDAVAATDDHLGILLDALDAIGVLEETLVIVSTDHGGERFSHGTNNDKQMAWLPFIVSGPNVKHNYSLEHEYIRNMDVVPTAAYALGAPLPEQWIGRPIVDAFINPPSGNQNIDINNLNIKPLSNPKELFARNAILIGIDALTADGFEQADTPNLDRLVASGSFTINGRATYPGWGLSGFASILFGNGPEEHSVADNDWYLQTSILTPITGSENLPPSIFNVIKQSFATSFTNAHYDWEKISRLIDDSVVDSHHIYPDSDDEAVIEGMIADLEEHDANGSAFPMFSFGYLENVAWAGFDHGWNSNQYINAIEDADALIGELLNALESSSLADNTIILVTTGNGANDAGQFNEQSMIIPFIISGPNIRSNYAISPLTYVRSFDAVATILYGMNITSFPSSFIAKPITEVFN